MISSNFCGLHKIYKFLLLYFVSITNFEKSRTSKMSPTKKMGQKPVQSSWLSPKATSKNRQRALSLDTGAKYLGFFSSRSLKTREKYISFAQFVYFLREVCLLFNFWMMKVPNGFFWHNCEFYHSKIEK